MRRDMDIIRNIVLAVENSQEIVREVDGITDDDFKYHAMLLKDANIVKASIIMSKGLGNNNIPATAIIHDLTWSGHDFASSIKNDDVWEKTKNRIKVAGSWTFSILLECLKEEAKKRIGTAIDL